MTFDAVEVRLEACYFRLISIVEAYLDVLCSELFREASSAQSELFRTLVAAAESKASTNWTERQNAFKSYHGASFSDYSSWSRLNSGIQVRNAIAHGLGGLTPRQREPKSRKKIEDAGVTIVDDKIRLSYDSVLRCLNTAKSFIGSVDSSIKRPTSV